MSSVQTEKKKPKTKNHNPKKPQKHSTKGRIKPLRNIFPLHKDTSLKTEEKEIKMGQKMIIASSGIK